MPHPVLSLARTLALLLAAASALAPGTGRTPVFRGTLSLAGRAVALFEVSGNTGTWQGEAGRTLPGSRWVIQKIDVAGATVTIKVGDRPGVTLHPGETFASDRVQAGLDPARAPGPMVSRGTPAELTVAPLVRALDASKDVPPLSSLARPGSTTVVMLFNSADAAAHDLKRRVLSLVGRRPGTAVVFVDAGGGSAPVVSAWNAGPLPHFILMDPKGEVTAAGSGARARVDGWLSGKK